MCFIGGFCSRSAQEAPILFPNRYLGTLSYSLVRLCCVIALGAQPTVAAIEAGKDIALANKETLIAGGPYILPLARKHGIRILPADSEHSAIFQVHPSCASLCLSCRRSVARLQALTMHRPQALTIHRPQALCPLPHSDALSSIPLPLLRPSFSTAAPPAVHAPSRRLLSHKGVHCCAVSQVFVLCALAPSCGVSPAVPARTPRRGHAEDHPHSLRRGIQVSHHNKVD